MKQQAGPCDTLTLKHYKQEASVAESASLAAASDLAKSLNVASAVESACRVHHRRVENFICSDACVSVWPARAASS